MRLMIIGQLEGYISAAGKIALQRGAKVIHCEDIEEAIGALRNGKGADVVMCDIKQKIGKFIADLEAERIHVPVVACGIGTDARSAVKAIEEGAKEYIPLPPDADLIAAILEAVTQESNTMIANDPSMKTVMALAEKIAPSEATVLITGESGTGKEVMSSFIHRKSKRKDEPFIALNCAAIPENLLESELFGHEKGAFTGATHRRIGKFEEAHGGTLLLDEISEMSVSLQAKLLRVLQEQQFERVGSGHTIETDVRIIATSNRNLGSEVRKGKFREDLYYRLNVIPIELPDLSQRREDIPLLAIHFMEKYAKLNDKNITSISESSMKILSEYNWHGNVRELENFIERAIVVSRTGTLNEADFPSQLFAVEENEIGEGIQAKASIHEMEKSLILKTLQANNGNRTRAAKSLGITTRTLRNKLHEYGLGSNH